MMFFALIKVKNRPKGQIGQKIEFLDLKNLLFSGIFLNGQSLCSKKLSGKGG